MISHNRVIRENVPRKIIEFSMGRHVGAPSDGHQRVKATGLCDIS